MSEVKIVDMRETPRMIRPGYIETMIRVSWRTDKGYTGVVEIPKAIATQEKIEAEIKKSVTDATEMIGSKIEV